MLKFLKMMVVEDVIITEETLVVDLVVAEVLLQEEKEILLQEEKVLEAEVLEAIEIQLLEKVVSEATEDLHQEEKAVSHQTEQLEMKVLLIELQDVQKALVMHQDQEDQEEINTFC
jgi:hypothetical protein